MTIEARYKAKVVSAKEAAAHVKSGYSIGIQGFNNYPQSIMDAILDRIEELEGVVVYDIPNPTDKRVNYFRRLLDIENSEKHIKAISLFTTHPQERELIRLGRGDQIPVHFSNMPEIFRRLDPPLGVVALEVSPMDEKGNFSYGLWGGYTKAMLERCKIVMVEVNENHPYIKGDCIINLSDINFIVENTTPQPVLPNIPPSKIEQIIADHIDPLILDGSMVQLGFGGIPNAIASCFGHKKDLGVHTEMLVDAYMELSEQGVITNAKKGINNGKMTVTFISGSKKLYDWCHNNDIIDVREVSYTNDPYVIKNNNKMIAINSIIACDLTGQVVCESIGPLQFTGTGGQLDFTRGAVLSPEGKAFLVTPSTGTKNEKMFKFAPVLSKGNVVSRIVPTHPPHAIVSVPRNDVDYIVTEYGAVSLRGKDRGERAKLLISIAHPDFRDELEREAREVLNLKF